MCPKHKLRAGSVPTPAPTAPSLEGTALYVANCQGCHGPNGEGTAGAPNIQCKTKEDIEDAIMDVPAMMVSPALQAFTFEEIEAIADFLGQFQ